MKRSKRTPWTEENSESARAIFSFFRQLVADNISEISWDWRKDRPRRTEFVLAALSFAINGFYQEISFFNPKHFKYALSNWKVWSKNNPELSKSLAPKIRMYENLVKENLAHELGEKLVDLCSSPSYPSEFLDFAVEYESSPYWHSIIYDFRKLLYISAKVKIGIFHLPTSGATKKTFAIDDKGQLRDAETYLHWKALLDDVTLEMKRGIKNNILENPSTVYLSIFIRETTANGSRTVDIYGYLYNREKSGHVTMQALS